MGQAIYNPATCCGAIGKQRKQPCRQAKGARTQHPGRGRCWLHGGISKKGDRRLTTGLTSVQLYQSNLQVKGTVEFVRKATQDAMDLMPELNIVRAMLHDYIDRHARLRQALIDWDQSWGPSVQILLNPAATPEEIVKGIELLRASVNGRPRESLEIEACGAQAERIARIVEKIHKIKQTSAVTFEAVQMLLERMGMVLIKHVKDQELVAAITRDWDDLEVPLSPQR